MAAGNLLGPVRLQKALVFLCTAELLNACLVVPLSVLDPTFSWMDRPIVVVYYIVVELCLAQVSQPVQDGHMVVVTGKLFNLTIASNSPSSSGKSQLSSR